MILGKLLPIKKFTFRFGQNKTPEPILSERDDKRHSLVREQFHFYNNIVDNNVNL